MLGSVITALTVHVPRNHVSSEARPTLPTTLATSYQTVLATQEPNLVN